MTWPSERRWALWSAFLFVHLLLAAIDLAGLANPFSDVTTIYRGWAADALGGGPIVGISAAWVYPLGALGPVLLAGLVPAHYGLAWLVLVTALDAAAFAVLLGRRSERADGGRRLVRRPRALAAWCWLAAQLALGPVALGRLDTVSVALAVIAVAVLARRPILAGVLLMAGAWIKFWPAALIAAALVGLRSRLSVLLGAVVLSALVVAAALVAGGGARLFSALGGQLGRGLQIEAPLATPWLWAAAGGASGTRIVFDDQLSTYQVIAPGAHAAGAIADLLLVLAVLVCAGLGVRAAARGRPRDATGATDAAGPVQLVALLSLALVAALIAFDKVGSPQYEAWYAAPVLLGILVGGRRWRLPALLVIAVCALTQVIYPWSYDALLAAQPWIVLVLTARNLLGLALLVWALAMLWRMPRAAASRSSSPQAEGIPS